MWQVSGSLLVIDRKRSTSVFDLFANEHLFLKSTSIFLFFFFSLEHAISWVQLLELEF